MRAPIRWRCGWRWRRKTMTEVVRHGGGAELVRRPPDGAAVFGTRPQIVAALATLQRTGRLAGVGPFVPDGANGGYVVNVRLLPPPERVTPNAEPSRFLTRLGIAAAALAGVFVVAAVFVLGWVVKDPGPAVVVGVLAGFVAAAIWRRTRRPPQGMTFSGTFIGRLH